VHPDPPDLPPQPEDPDLAEPRIVEARLVAASLAGERRVGLPMLDCELRGADLTGGRFAE
jgi:hypothetical protein